jgi:hypothetical protein
MAQVIKLKRSAVSGSVPLTSQLELGEVAINTYDGKMYIKKNDGADAIIEIGGFSSSATTPASPTGGQLWYDTANATLKYYTGAVWENIIGSDYQSNIITSTTVPTTAPDGSTVLAAGDMYYNTSDKHLYVHDGTSWGLVNNNVQVDSDYVDSVVSKVQSNLDSDVGVLNTSISTIVGGNFIDSDYVANAISNVAGTLVDSDYVETAIADKIYSLDFTYVDSDFQAVSYLETVGTTNTLGGIIVLHLKTGNLFNYTTNTNHTFAFNDLPSTANPYQPPAGTAYGFTLVITAGGSHTLTWPASVKWAGGSAPDSPASGETDVYTFFTYDSGTTWYGARAIDAGA